jgi:hypothetical protein
MIILGETAPDSPRWSPSPMNHRAGAIRVIVGLND